MSGGLTSGALMSKAVRACASARALLNLNDVDGACNRAYYAMFDAARAALLASGAPTTRHWKNSQWLDLGVWHTPCKKWAHLQRNGASDETS